MTTCRLHLAVALLAALAGCNSGSKPPSTPGGSAAGIALPTEISALPTKGTAASPLAGVGRSSLALTTSSDYELARTVKYVNEPALSQFDIFNTIFNALGQTHYADPANVGQGPYGSMVSWIEDHGDQETKQLVPWVVDSSLVAEGGKTVNRVQVWFPQVMGDGLQHLIRIQLVISEPPTQKADGSYADYGVWRLDARFDDAGQRFFAASASRSAGGLSVVMLHELDKPGEETRGILEKSDALGFGRVVFPDYGACNSQDCQPQPLAVAYVYDADHVALATGTAPVIFKDRAAVVDLVNRYGLFDAVTGEDVAKTHAFGFPLRFHDAQGVEQYAYYGAWQGHHQVWGNGQAVPGGTIVARGDLPPGASAETYTVSDPYVGTLVKRTLLPATLQDVKGVVANTWVSQSLSLTFDGAGWTSCLDPVWTGAPQPTCGPGSGPVSDLSFLASDPADRTRSVNIGRWDMAQQRNVNLVYDGTAAKFYEAAAGSPGSPPTSTGVQYVPLNGDQLWVNVNGSVYVYFDGNAWMKKQVVAFDASTNTPTFGAGDTAFSLELARDYYLNDNGASYLVRRTGATTYDVEIERQAVANPVNAAQLVVAGTIFKRQWGGDTATTFRFVTDPASASFLKLVYDVPGTQDAAAGAVAGAGATSPEWGLIAWVNGAATAAQYNWDYPAGGDGSSYGAQQFLKAADGSFKLLDDPIRLAPISLTSHGGDTKTYALQFDGSWVGGLPDVYNELRKNGFLLTDAIAAQVVVIPTGTVVTDAGDTTRHYLFKPLQISESLIPIADPGGLGLSAAAGLDLSTVPDFVEHGMGAMPVVAVKYSEGNPVH